MSPTRTTRMEPHVVSYLVGLVVSAVSAITGVVAHGVAASSATPLPDVLTMGWCVSAGALIGGATTALYRRFPVVPVSAIGLLCGQVVVHWILVSRHVASGSPHLGSHGPGHAAGAESAAVVHTAMDSTPQQVALPSHLSAGMVLAHLAAIAITVTVMALVAAALAWLGARIAVVVRCPWVDAVRRPRLLLGRPVIAIPSYWGSGGGTRAPPR